jgi:hypothetical protein
VFHKKYKQYSRFFRTRKLKTKTKTK